MYVQLVPESATMTSLLKILVIEDSAADYLLLERFLHQHGVLSELKRIDNYSELDAALNEVWHVVLIDHDVPGMDLQMTLQTINAKNPNLPVILVSGTIEDKDAVGLMHQGIADFVLKDRLARLPDAIKRAIDWVEERRLRQEAEAALLESEEKYRLLFESSRDALMLVTLPYGKVTRANRATLELFSASNEEAIQKLVPSDFSPERQPDGQLSSEKAQEMIGIATREGSHLFEWKHQRLNGQTFDANVLLSRIVLNG